MTRQVGERKIRLYTLNLSPHTLANVSIDFAVLNFAVLNFSKTVQDRQGADSRGGIGPSP